MLNVICTRGDESLARVFVAELGDGSMVECVESVQPPRPRDEKWVLIVSTLKGCPVSCPICDAGGTYRGKLTANEIFDQIEFLVDQRYPDRRVPVKKLKIQFARMGDPAFNPAVLQVLKDLPERLDAPGLMPSISTVAPKGCERFLDDLLKIKEMHYGDGHFQMQFSLHTTCDVARSELIPIRTMELPQIAAYGDRFFRVGDRKVTLNFAPATGYPLDPQRLAELFSPERFAIKLTPINPTKAAERSGLVGVIDPADPAGYQAVVDRFTSAGFDTILSIGELRENQIGSNCGMYVAELEMEKTPPSAFLEHRPTCTG